MCRQSTLLPVSSRESIHGMLWRLSKQYCRYKPDLCSTIPPTAQHIRSGKSKEQVVQKIWVEVSGAGSKAEMAEHMFPRSIQLWKNQRNEHLFLCVQVEVAAQIKRISQNNDVSSAVPAPACIEFPWKN